MVAVLSLCSCQSQSSPDPSASVPPHSGEERFFVGQIKPLLEMNCVRCHAGGASRLNLSRRETAFAPVKNGTAFIIPGRPDQSRLVTAISRPGTHPLLMPHGQRLSLTDDQIGMLREWIEEGAAWPDGPAGELQAKVNPEAETGP
jgi:hypothetical protein